MDQMNRLAAMLRPNKIDGMITEKEIKEMPMDQKLRLIEALWDDIGRHDQDYDSPRWHQEALESTEERRRAGLEEPIDWEAAKERLGKREDEI